MRERLSGRILLRQSRRSKSTISMKVSQRNQEFLRSLDRHYLTLASPASVAGAACALAQGVTDAIVRCKRLLGALLIIFD
jgi:hypothetical protein